MSSGNVAQDKTFKSKEQAEEARYIQQKEQEQLAAIRRDIETKGSPGNTQNSVDKDKDFEGGHGGQEDLEDRYATTSGEH